MRSSFGGIGLRLGAGYGTFDDVRAPLAVATLTYGFHSVPARNTEILCGKPDVVVPRVAEAAFGRIFVTHRRAVGAGVTWEVSAGVELTPSWLLRPLRQLFWEY